MVAPAVLDAPQLGLFDQRTLGLADASAALVRGDVDAAHAAFISLRNRLPSDPVICEQARAVADLRSRCNALSMLPSKPRAIAQLCLARELLQSTGALHEYGKLLVCVAARQWCIAVGDAELLDGRLSGEWFLSHGAFDDALASLERAAEHHRSARILLRLGDVHTMLGQPSLARLHVRDALLLDPFHDAFQELLDDSVRALPDTARYEIGIEDEPMAWAAPVGIVTGLFPRLLHIDVEFGDTDVSRTRAQRDALQRARVFTRMLTKIASPHVRKNSEALIDARRTMKNACPELFQVVLRERR